MFLSRSLFRRAYLPSLLKTSVTSLVLSSSLIRRRRARVMNSGPNGSNSRIRLNERTVSSGTHPRELQAVRVKKYLSMGKLESEK